MTEPKVVRYDCWCSDKREEPVEVVRHSDYEALAAENAKQFGHLIRAETKVERLRKKLDNTSDDLGKSRARVQELEAQNEGLRLEVAEYLGAFTENTRLREALEMWYDHHNMNCRCPGCLAVEAALKEKKP